MAAKKRGRPSSREAPQVIDDEASSVSASSLSETTFEPSAKKAKVVAAPAVRVEVPRKR